MNGAVLLGVGLATGLLIVLAALMPARTPLAIALARLYEPRADLTDQPSERLLVRLLGQPIARTQVGVRLLGRWQRDLRVTGRTADELVAQQVLCAFGGLLWAPATAAIVTLGGVTIPVAIPVWCALVLGIAGALVPAIALKAAATQRRRGFRHALSCYLDLVAVRLAGGAGIESALTSSAEGGDGWAFRELRQSLAEARLMGEPPWAGFDRLGTAIDVSELNELAASVTLAGDEGARIRTSIAAKARSIRTRGLADAEGEAQAANERMSLPIVLLMFGFVVFLGYPAVMQVLTGL